ncbi:MAG: cytochrome b/b6 domain-containing protein [Burkholderiales bacterium]|nr:cytochrome b/b6 domain-containing protein [Burkholderiales bacterium]
MQTVKYIQIHSLLARYTHGDVAICCIIRAVTGLFVFIPAANTWAGADFAIIMRWTHRIVAIPFIVIPLLAFIFSFKGARHLFGQNIFGKWYEDDYIFAAKFLPYLFMPKKIHMPPQYEVKGAQRIADGVLVFACIFIAISGMVMWLNNGLLPEGVWAVNFSQTTVLTAKLVHDVCFLIIAVVGLAHIYLGAGIFQPYRGTANLMWGDGKVSEPDAAYHWGYWAGEELASGKNVTAIEKGK